MLSVCQDVPDDLVGKLIEGLFECIDQYESDLNGVRTSASMAEAVRQGYFPGARPPFGYRTSAIELRPGVVRHKLVPHEHDAETVREIFRLYIARSGAKAVAHDLNRRGLRYRTGARWTKDLVLRVLDESAIAGTYRWGRKRHGEDRPRSEWLSLNVPPLVDSETYALARELRARRSPTAASGRASAKPHLLTGLLRCGQCGASYQLETSGKRVDDCMYRYCYYNCRSYCRSGKSVCIGQRVDTATLDAAVLRFVADAVCREDRARHLRRTLGDRGVHLEDDVLARAWRGAILEDPHIGRTYLVRLVDRVEVHGERIVVVARSLPENGEDDAVGESRNPACAVDERAPHANAK